MNSARRPNSAWVPLLLTLPLAATVTAACSGGTGETTDSATNPTTINPTVTTTSGMTTGTDTDPSTTDPSTSQGPDPSTTDPTTSTTTDPTTSTSSSTTSIEPGVCGNGVHEEDEGEFCDGADLPYTKCSDLDPVKYVSGDLDCTILCQYDYSDCEQVPCEAPSELLPCDDDSEEFLHALGLNCFEVDAQLYTDENSQYAYDFTMLSPDPTAWRVVKQYGSHFEGNQPFWGPTHGDRFVIVSNGSLPEVDFEGKLFAPPGSAQNGGLTNNNNPGNVMSLPGDMSWMQGSNMGNGGTPFNDCDLQNDCSDTLDAQWNLGEKVAHDVIFFEIELRPPKGTFGFEFDFAFFSAEYPEFADGGMYNDMVIAWSTSESYTGNVTFLFDEDNNAQPLTVTALSNNGLIEYGPSDPELNNTGYDDVGGSTSWIKAAGVAQPQEMFHLSFTVLDKVDAEINTQLLLDNFRWTCAGCDIQSGNGCGVIG